MSLNLSTYSTSSTQPSEARPESVEGPLDLKYFAYVLSLPFSTITNVLKPSSLAPRQISKALWEPIVAIIYVEFLDINHLTSFWANRNKFNWNINSLFYEFDKSLRL